MLKGVSQTFIDNCNSKKLTYKEYIILDGITIPVNAKLSDDCYENGNFIGNFIFKTITFTLSNEYNFKAKEFEYYKVVNGESIKIGTFITTEIEDNDTTELVKVIGMDYGLKTQIEYTSSLDYASGEITLLDVWNECCDLCELESGIEHFTNDDFIVDTDQFTGTGALVRDVFIGIALSSGSFIKVMNDDKIYPVFKETTNEIIEDYTELEDKRDTRPISCVRLGLSQIDGEKVDLIDPDLVEEYGENWLILNDNPFAYNQNKREQLITAIFNKVKGFGYSSFVSETSFKPYLTCGDTLRFRNRKGQLVDSILLRYTHEYTEDDLDIHLEAPSETSATVNYIYPLSALNIAKNTQIIVDKQEGQITSLTEQTQVINGNITGIQNDLLENYYNIDKTNELIQTAQTGLTNTFSEAGGNNILRNTGLWFTQNDENNPYEFWEGKVKKLKEEKANNISALLLQNGTLTQEQTVPDNNYTISFKYKKLVSLATVKVVINGDEYELTATNDTEFMQTIDVTTKHVNVQFVSDTNDSCEIYDLMVNAGSVKLAYSQNQNETTTDTVNISKGITITSSDTDVTFKANADGIRTLDRNGSRKTEFTDTGMITTRATIEEEAEVVSLLHKKVGNHIWVNKI